MRNSRTATPSLRLLPTCWPRACKTLIRRSDRTCRRRRAIVSCCCAAGCIWSSRPTTEPRPGRIWSTERATRATVDAVKMMMMASMRVSDLDFDDLPDPEKAEQLHRYGRYDQDLANRIGEENRHVLRIQRVENRKKYEGQG